MKIRESSKMEKITTIYVPVFLHRFENITADFTFELWIFHEIPTTLNCIHAELLVIGIQANVY